MRRPNTKLIDKNIFLAMERYLVNPTKKHAKQIKKLSSELTVEAIKQAHHKRVTDAFEPDSEASETVGVGAVEVGADEFGPILLKKIANQAREAFPFSTRMVMNGMYAPTSATEAATDPAYIFKLSEDEKNKFFTLKGELLKGGKNAFRPDGFIYAYSGYLDRAKESNYSYCKDPERTIYKNNALLYAKAAKLIEKGDTKAAKVLIKTCTRIKNLCNDQPDLLTDNTVNSIIETLDKASENPEIQRHTGIKQILVNFLIALTGVGLIYLAATANTRGRFWYHPSTDKEKMVKNFSKELKSNKIHDTEYSEEEYSGEEYSTDLSGSSATTP